MCFFCLIYIYREREREQKYKNEIYRAKNLKSFLVNKPWPVFVATVNLGATWFEQHSILSRKAWDHKIVVAIVSKFATT